MADTALFTVAEARAFRHAGDVPLSAETISDDDIEACELEVRDVFLRACGVDFFPTEYTETLDGNATTMLRVSRKNPTKEHPRRALTVSAATIDTTALTAGELGYIKAHPDGRLVRTDGNSWSSSTGYQDLAVEIEYTVGWAAVPKAVKDAALKYAVHKLIGSDIPDRATSMHSGDVSYSLTYAGRAPHWTGLPEVDAVLSAYREDEVVIA